MDITPEKRPHIKYPTLAAMATAAVLAASLGSCTQTPMRTGGKVRARTSGTQEQGLIGTPCVGSPAKPVVTMEDGDNWNRREGQRLPGKRKKAPAKPLKEDIPPVVPPAQALGGAQVVKTPDWEKQDPSHIHVIRGTENDQPDKQ